MPAFVYEGPSSLADTFDVLEAYGRDASPLAGGTDLVVGLRKGRTAARALVDLKRLADLRASIGETGGCLVITAPTTLGQLIADQRVRRSLPALAEAARTVGSVQIRNRATLAGNICNASPAADTAPPLLAYGASVVLTSRHGSRRLPAADFLLGPRRTARLESEIMTGIEIPVPPGPAGSCFTRLTRRRGVDLATISVCCSMGPRSTTLAFGAAGPRPFAVTDDSGLLADPDGDPAARESLLREFAAQASPISDIRGSREYREAMLLTLSERAVATARSRRGEG